MDNPVKKNLGARRLLWLVLAVAAVLVLLLLLRYVSKTDDTGQTVTVGNSNPTVDTVNVAIISGGDDQATITLVENSTKTIYIHGTATDNNGCNNVDTPANWTVKIYRTDRTSGCSADDNDCYLVATATDLALTNCTGAGDMTLSYEATDTLQYYADATDAGSPNAATTWSAKVTATDEDTGSGMGSDTFEMNSLVALGATASINYGTLGLGETSAEQTLTVTNTGNRAIDSAQTGDDMSCDGVGSDPVDITQAHWSFTGSFAWGDGTALANTGGDIDLDLAQRTGAASTKDMYLLLKLPATGVEGVCTNTVTLTAEAENAD